MMDSEMLRKFASELRIEAGRRETARRERATHVIKAAAGLGMLKLSLRGKS